MPVLLVQTSGVGGPDVKVISAHCHLASAKEQRIVKANLSSQWGRAYVVQATVGVSVRNNLDGSIVSVFDTEISRNDLKIAAYQSLNFHIRLSRRKGVG